MTLKELLEKMVHERMAVLLKDKSGAREPCDLLTTLSAPMLGKRVHLQPGLYVALINDKGYLGEVLFKIESKCT